VKKQTVNNITVSSVSGGDILLEYKQAFSMNSEHILGLSDEQKTSIKNMQQFNTKVNNSWSKCYHVNTSNNANRHADWMLRLIQNRIMQVYWNTTLYIREENFSKQTA